MVRENLFHASILGSSVLLAIFDTSLLAEASLQSLPSSSYDALPVFVSVSKFPPHYKNTGHTELESHPPPGWASQVAQNPPASAGNARDMGSTPGSGRSPGVVHDNPLQYSCLETSMGRNVWWATVLSVTKRWICLSE